MKGVFNKMTLVSSNGNRQRKMRRYTKSQAIGLIMIGVVVLLYEKRAIVIKVVLIAALFIGTVAANASLSKKADALSQENEELKLTLSTLNSRSMENAALDLNVNDLKFVNENVDYEFINLSSRNTDLSLLLEILTSENAGLTSEVENLMALLEDAWTQLQKAQSELQSFKEFENEIFLRTMFCEFGGEIEREQLAGAATILNRINAADFPNTLLEVIFEPWQFTPATTGRVFTVNVPDANRVQLQSVIDRARAGEDPTQQVLGGGGALYFYAPRSCSAEALAARENIELKIQIGNTVFYRVWNQ